MTTPHRSLTSRRRVVGGAAGLTLGLPLLAACGGGSSTASDPTTRSGDEPSTQPTGEPTSDGSTGSTGATAAPAGLVATSAVPVGGGVVLPDDQLVVTQPTSGEFKAFSAVCTHQGCLVASVSDGQIQCPCHGSEYDAGTGAVTRGPATVALSEVPVKASGGQIVPA